jgi:hypothetical protein
MIASICNSLSFRSDQASVFRVAKGLALKGGNLANNGPKPIQISWTVSYPSTGLTAAGLPVGLELDARPGSDRRLSSIGLAPRVA